MTEKRPKTPPTFEQLRMMAGHELGVSDWTIVDQGRIDQFAECTGDHQWIHVDTERAKRQSPFRTTIAHGYLTLSIIGALAQLKAAPNDLVFYPAAVRALHTELRGPALLTGFMDACLAYDVSNLRCPSIPGTPIRTDHGNLYFQKQTLYGKGIFTAATGSVL